MTLNFEVTVSTLSWVNDVATHCHPCRPFGHETITSVAHWVLSQNFPFGLSWWLSHLKKHPVDHHLVEIIINGIPTMFIGLCFETSVYMVYKPIFWGKPVKPRASFGIPSVFWTTMDPFETNIDTGKPNPMWSKTPRNPPEPGHPAPPGEQDIESKTPSSNCGYLICLNIAIYFKTSSTPIFGGCMFIGCFPYAHHILVFLLCLFVPCLQAGPMHVCKLLSMLQA